MYVFHVDKPYAKSVWNTYVDDLDGQMLVSPADYVIRMLGGLTKTANALGLAVTTVQGWKVRGRIPQDRWEKLIAVAKDDGKNLELSDFLKDHEVEEERAA